MRVCGLILPHLQAVLPVMQFRLSKFGSVLSLVTNVFQLHYNGNEFGFLHSISPVDGTRTEWQANPPNPNTALTTSSSGARALWQ